VEVFITNNPASPTQWLSKIELSLTALQAKAQVSQSTALQQSFTLVQGCDYQTCNGCLDLNVLRLCYAAQQCTLAKCIGTLTNQNRPLCGIGQTAQATYITLVAAMQSAYTVIVQTLAVILKLSLDGSQKKSIQVNVSRRERERACACAAHLVCRWTWYKIPSTR